MKKLEGVGAPDSVAVEQRQGIAFAVLTALMFSGSDALIKQLVVVTSFVLLLWLRYVFQLGLLTLWLFGTRKLFSLRLGSLRLQGIRCLFLLCSSMAGYLSLGKVPLAEYTALMMLSPVVSVVLGRLIMKEQVSELQWVLVAVGLGGMLAVVRPGFSLWSVYTLLPIVSAFFYAAFQMVSRRVMTESDVATSNWLSAVFIVSTVGIVLLLLPEDGHPVVWLDGPWWGMFALMCLIATAGQISLAAALQKSNLAVVAPFAYFQIVFAAVIGKTFFDQWPDGMTIIGIFMITLAGIGSAWSNGRTHRSLRATN